MRPAGPTRSRRSCRGSSARLSSVDAQLDLRRLEVESTEVVDVARGPVVGREKRRRVLGLEPDAPAPERNVPLEEVCAARSEDGKPVPLQRVAEESQLSRTALFSPLNDTGVASRRRRPPLAQARGGEGRWRPKGAGLVLPGAVRVQQAGGDRRDPGDRDGTRRRGEE